MEEFQYHESVSAIVIDCITLIVLLIILSTLFQRRKIPVESTALDIHRFNVLFDHYPDGVALFDLDGRFITANRVTQTIFGYDSSELCSNTFHFNLVEEDKERVLEFFKKTVQGTTQKYEVSITNKQDKRVDLKVINIPIIHNHVVIGVYGIAKDVSEQKKIEKALKLAKYNLKNSVRQQQGITFAFVKKNDKFIFTLCDGQLLYKFSLSPEKVIGKELHHCIPEIADFIIPYYERAWSGEENVAYETDIGDITLYITLSPIRRNERIVQVIGSAIDITERKKVENALRDSEEKYRLIAENMTDLISVVDKKGSILYGSPSHKMVLGYDPSQFHGMQPNELFHQEDFPRISHSFNEVFLNKQPCHIEFRFKHANGNWLFLEAKGTPVVDENGEIKSIVFVSRDITERKQTEEYLRKSDRLGVVGQLAAGVAHEIRNPLTSLKGFLQLLEPDIVEKRFYDIMSSELNRIESIISEYLILAKPQIVNFQSKEIQSVLKHVISLAETQAIMNSIEIIFEYEEDLPLVSCEENQLKQVFINIVKNAIDAMPKGGLITIVVKRYEADQILIRFTDQGCGIPEDMLVKLGEPFYTTKDKGTGLGLMVSYKIIENHNGSIRIQSVEGKGTDVEIQLPVSIQNNDPVYRH